MFVPGQWFCSDEDGILASPVPAQSRTVAPG